MATKSKSEGISQTDRLLFTPLKGGQAKLELATPTGTLKGVALICQGPEKIVKAMGMSIANTTMATFHKKKLLKLWPLY